MDTLLKADIFFFVTTIVVTVLAVLGIIILVYVASIARNVSEMTKRVKEEVGATADDFKEMRGKVKQEGFRIAQLMRFWESWSGRKAQRKTGKSRRET